MRQTWKKEVENKLREWGPLPKEVAISRLTNLMPPGYAWQRHVIDTKLRQRMEEKGEWEQGDPMPAPRDAEDYYKAQRALVKWFLRQIRRQGRLIEEDGMIEFRKKE